MKLSYEKAGRYEVGKPQAQGKGVYDLLRPKSLAEVNRWRRTPFTERLCWTCRKKLYDHWYLVFLNAQKLSRLYCYRDGTAYYWKEKYRL